MDIHVFLWGYLEIYADYILVLQESMSKVSYQLDDYNMPKCCHLPTDGKQIGSKWNNNL